MKLVTEGIWPFTESSFLGWCFLFYGAFFFFFFVTCKFCKTQNSHLLVGKSGFYILITPCSYYSFCSEYCFTGHQCFWEDYLKNFFSSFQWEIQTRYLVSNAVGAEAWAVPQCRPHFPLEKSPQVHSSTHRSQPGTHPSPFFWWCCERIACLWDRTRWNEVNDMGTVT